MTIRSLGCVALIALVACPLVARAQTESDPQATTDAPPTETEAAPTETVAPPPAPPPPSPWHVALALGDDAWVSGRVGQHGFALLDARRTGVANGQLHLLYNTDTVQVGLEGIRLAGGKLEASIVGRGEALLAGLLFDYYRRGTRDTSRSFFASYAQLLPSLKWHVAPRHSLELVTGVRAWFFRRNASTDAGFTLPADTFVFEPRLNYTYWAIRAPGAEWEAHRIFPRIEGVAVGVSLGLDRRTARRAWGADVGGGQLDPRNAPGDVILTARQWLYAGVRLAPAVRLQFEEHASYGRGEDDITRNRLGGMNPYVVPIAGLPWAVALSERLASARATMHVRVGRTRHELGVGADGAVFADPYRTGDLRRYGGAGGAFAFGDFRTTRWQFHGRFGYGFPVPWIDPRPNVSLLVTAGVRVR